MSFRAFHSSMLDQLTDVIGDLRARIPAQRFVVKNPDRPPHEQPPPEDLVGAPTEHHASLLEIAPDREKPWRVTELRWWPELDRLCELRDRWKRYHNELGTT